MGGDLQARRRGGFHETLDAADEASQRNDMADSVGRDYTTVSRQVAELESLGLVERSESAADRRVREAVVTAKGKAMTDLVDATRERMAGRIFATWEK